MGKHARTAVAAWVAGVLVVLSALLEWIQLNSAGVAFAGGGVGGSAKGIETGVYGWATIVLGVALMVGGYLSVTTPLRLFASPVVLVSGAASLALATFIFISLESRFVDFAVREAASTNLPAIKIKSLLSDLFAQGSISVRSGTGLIALAVGGAIGIVAGVAGLVRPAIIRLPDSKPPAPQVPVPARPSGKDNYGF